MVSPRSAGARVSASRSPGTWPSSPCGRSPPIGFSGRCCRGWDWCGPSAQRRCGDSSACTCRCSCSPGCSRSGSRSTRSWVSRGTATRGRRPTSPPISASCSLGSKSCPPGRCSRRTTRRWCGCTRGARRSPSIYMATTGRRWSSPPRPTSARTSSARASPTSSSPARNRRRLASSAPSSPPIPGGWFPCTAGPAPAGSTRWPVSARRLYLIVAAAAAVVHLGVLWNGFVLDDLSIILANPVVHSLSGVWQAFGTSYFPSNIDVSAYRPLTVATYALDWSIHSTAWFHAVNLLWHVGASVLVAVLGRRWAGDAAGLVAGLVFAVHPVHVEAVANVVGRAELMAACFSLLAVYAALERDSVGWTAAALALGLVSKENAAVVPGLIASAWILGVRPLPPKRRLGAYVVSWALVGAAYAIARWAVLHPYARTQALAPVFFGASPVAVRLTAVAALGDVGRLLLFPLTLRADYSPDERTLVRSLVDGRFLLGLVVLVAWVGLLWWAWRRRRRIEALGLAWIAIAYLPVANLLFP